MEDAGAFSDVEATVQVQRLEEALTKLKILAESGSESLESEVAKGNLDGVVHRILLGSLLVQVRDVRVVRHEVPGLPEVEKAVVPLIVLMEKLVQALDAEVCLP